MAAVIKQCQWSSSVSLGVSEKLFKDGSGSGISSGSGSSSGIAKWFKYPAQEYLKNVWSVNLLASLIIQMGCFSASYLLQIIHLITLTLLNRTNTLNQVFWLDY